MRTFFKSIAFCLVVISPVISHADELFAHGEANLGASLGTSRQAQFLVDLKFRTGNRVDHVGSHKFIVTAQIGLTTGEDADILPYANIRIVPYAFEGLPAGFQILPAKFERNFALQNGLNAGISIAALSIGAAGVQWIGYEWSSGFAAEALVRGLGLLLQKSTTNSLTRVAFEPVEVMAKFEQFFRHNPSGIFFKYTLRAEGAPFITLNSSGNAGGSAELVARLDFGWQGKKEVFDSAFSIFVEGGTRLFYAEENGNVEGFIQFGAGGRF